MTTAFVKPSDYTSTDNTTADQHQVLSMLNQLIRLNKESERGFETAAEHVKNRGLKIVLKTFAQQRACFAADLAGAAAMIRPDWLSQSGARGPSHRILASVHRGWIDIKAAMAVGRESTERVVLTEGQRAEGGIAVREYQKALRMNLSEALHAQIQSQLEQIQAAHQRLSLLSGQHGRRQIVQLFDTPQDANHSVDRLRAMGIASKMLSVTPVEKVMEFYECNCQSSRIWDGVGAGSVVGIVLGLVIGMVVGFSAYAGTASAMISTLWIPAFLGILIGAIGGAFFGALIGQATTEDDLYDYHESMRLGSTLVVVEVAETQAAEIQQQLRNQRLQTEQVAVA